MNKDELIKKLNDEFKIDVDGLSMQITTLTSELDVVKADLQTALDSSIEAKEALKAQEVKVETDKVEAILSDLIEAGKSSQDLNDSIYRNAFISMGSEKAVEAAEKMPVVVKTSRDSVDDANDSAGLSDKELDHKAITALAKKEDIGYSDAANMYFAQKDKKGDE